MFESYQGYIGVSSRRIVTSLTYGIPHILEPCDTHTAMDQKYVIELSEDV